MAAAIGFDGHEPLQRLELNSLAARLTPLQAVQTATINPARFLGREDTQGTIEAGKRANLILLEANPLVDIRNVAQIEDVVARGKLVTKPATAKILAGHRRTSGTKWLPSKRRRLNSI